MKNKYNVTDLFVSSGGNSKCLKTALYLLKEIRTEYPYI
jgi:hypothetical protein